MTKTGPINQLCDLCTCRMELGGKGHFCPPFLDLLGHNLPGKKVKNGLLLGITCLVKFTFELTKIYLHLDLYRI